MKPEELERCQKINLEVTNFIECYKEEELWGSNDGPVDAYSLLCYLVANPHLQEIAEKVSKMMKINKEMS